VTTSTQMKKEKERDLDKARKYCLRLIAISPRSRRAIEIRLEKAGFSEVTVNETVERLVEAGLIDDLAFARQWIEYRVRTSPRGRAMIRVELAKKGIPREVAEKAVTEDPGLPPEKEMARGLIEDRIGPGPLPADMKSKGKLYRYLIGKGFSCDVAEEALDGVFGSVGQG
jgi:regulatory protein